MSQSKAFWLEEAIRDAVDLFYTRKDLLTKWLTVGTNRIKIIAAVMILVGGYTACKKYLSPKKKRDSEKTPEEKAAISAQKQRTSLDKVFFKKFSMVMNVALPTYLSKEGFIMAALTTFTVLQSLVTNVSNSVQGDLMLHLVDRNPGKYMETLLKLVGVLSCNAIITPLINYGMEMLSLKMRRNLTLDIHKKYYAHMMYYRVQNLDKRINNPDQLITQDVEVLCKQVANLFVDFLAPITDVCLYSYQMYHLIGSGGPLSIVTYLIVAFAFIKAVTPNFTKMSSEVQNLEGKFRGIHARTRINAESIAFYGGDKKERTIIEKYFDDLVKYSDFVINKNFVFGVVNDYFTKYCPHTIILLIGAAPVFFGRLRLLESGQLMGQLRYLVSVASYEFFALGKLIELFRKLLKISGYTNRVHSLFEVMTDLESRISDKKYKGEMKDSDVIRFQDVSIYTPAEVLLAKKLRFTVQRGKNTVITGPNGCGKSSLFRVLGGLWPLHEGVISKPGATDAGLFKDIFYLPQKPYNVIGSLRDQIIYPDRKLMGKTDSDLKKLLEMFKIGYLSSRHVDGFDGRQDWDNLSRGEQQRLAMVRLFYHQPRYAILDECTSTINRDAETDLYKYCKEFGITCITISHRPALDQFHDYRLVFDGEGGWKYEQIDQETNNHEGGKLGRVISAFDLSMEDQDEDE
ncbi:peroxisomal long-chain fatty acid import protein [Acrasis kona]|uniref:Peroxisomal long-chain fatty acid import protein n=1 Tax=Acrasis kona TaxID=1008807 RepID=A0AAW2ZIZ0_9EUKA